MFTECRVMQNRIVVEGYWRMKLQVGALASMAQPGQFIMLKCWEGSAPFFMRPFSINSVDKKAGTLDLLYKVVGKGTRIMTALAEGAAVQMLGPLGHGFPLDEKHKRIALVGRGVGAAPMRYLAEVARNAGMDVYVYLSAGREEYLFDLKHYVELGCITRSTTSWGQLVTAFFEEDLTSLRFDAAYTCGSKRLMRDIGRLANGHGFAAYVSLEEHMACGIGACKGCICSVQGKDGEERYANVCKEGPVFPIERLVR